MLYFNENLIIEKIAPHYGELARIVKEAHTEFLKFPAMDGLDYTGLPYASIMLVKIKDLLSRSYLVQKGFAEIEPYYSTFRLNFSGIKISFNKVDNKKRKCRDIMEPNISKIDEKYFKQVSLFPEDSIFNQYIISNQSPLTVGYAIKDVEISKVYLTHQVGKNVHWHNEITAYAPMIVSLQKIEMSSNSTKQKRRIFSKNIKSSNEKDKKSI